MRNKFLSIGYILVLVPLFFYVSSFAENTSTVRYIPARDYFTVVEQFIGLEEKYGLEKMERAKKIIAQKSPDNPRRTVGYFVNTVTALP
jgi:hypothetical protein